MSRPTALLFIALPLSFAASAAEVDKSRLPPSASRAVDFARDIRPILEKSCHKCHGPQKQKGGLRLDDRNAAMKGGENGPVIVAGRSADSPLIHLVSRRVKDSEMPPDGKGDPLTPEQIGLLRAWIDGGAKWAAAAPAKTAAAKRATAPLPPAARRKVDFARDIQPIFAASCYVCHGPGDQRGGLRLDAKKDALKGGTSGPVIIAGKSASSRLVHLIAGVDPNDVMPKKGERLTADQVGLLRAWIDQGADWPDTAHWSLAAPKRPSIPRIRNTQYAIRNPIDHFILARLEKERLSPSPEADRVTLIRRLSLDLRGLPPSVEEAREFLADHSPDAYEKLVDRLLASPHFGERWARHWLDLARYADSDGYEKDTDRPYAWLYRDWVIRALNRDMPFDQFTVEQLAGDLLPNATLDQKIATGFHRNTLTNKEGGVDPEEFRCKAVVDRVSTTSTVWLGLTMNCAECHNHKYDPLTQKEFYQLFAFFNDADEKDLPAPQPAELAAYEAKKKTWDAERAKLQAALDAWVKNEMPAQLAAWEQRADAPATRWTVLEPKKVTASNGTVLQIQPDQSVIACDCGQPPDKDTYTVEFETDASGLTGFRLELLPASDRKNKVGRAANGNFVLSEFTVKSGTRPVPLQHAAADFVQTGWSAAGALDGDRKTGWAVLPRTDQPHVAVFETKENVALAPGGKLTITLDQQYGGRHTIARFRIAASRSPRPLQPGCTPDAVVTALQTAAAQRTPAQKEALAKYFSETVDADARQLRRRLDDHAKKEPKPPPTAAATLAVAETTRKTHVHVRGDFLRPGDEVQPGTPAVLHPLRKRGAKPDRLDLARWLTDPANPLTARVAVNRMWQNLFGRALVPSVQDFGTRGERPSHPELLDWLAVEFRERGWSQKAMIKLIVTSATYRQSSRHRPELAARDPLNTLLARQNRFRLEAENVRDLYLAASGLLHPAVGGPSIRPPMPQELTKLNYANGMKWTETTGPDKYRRGLYIFFKRTVPYPSLMTFDAPDSNVCCARRDRSNTPLQALTTLNDPVFFECAQALGRSLAASPANDTAARLAAAIERCLSRKPTKAEMARLQELHAGFLRLLQAAPDSAAKIAGDAKLEPQKLAETASLVAVSRTIMNLDEFLTRE